MQHQSFAKGLQNKITWKYSATTQPRRITNKEKLKLKSIDPNTCTSSMILKKTTTS